MIDDDWDDGLVLGVTINAGDSGYEEDRVLVALPEDGVLAVELGHGGFGDEELGAVGARAGVSHGEATRDVKGQVGRELVVEIITGIAKAGANGVAALNHEFGNDAVEDGSVVERLVMDLLQGGGISPVFGPVGETNEVSHGVGSLVVVEFAGEPAHGRVNYCGGTGGSDGSLRLAGGAGRVGEVVLAGTLSDSGDGEREANNDGLGNHYFQG